MRLGDGLPHLLASHRSALHSRALFLTLPWVHWRAQSAIACHRQKEVEECYRVLQKGAKLQFEKKKTENKNKRKKHAHSLITLNRWLCESGSVCVR